MLYGEKKCLVLITHQFKKILNFITPPTPSKIKWSTPQAFLDHITPIPCLEEFAEEEINSLQ